MSIKINKDGSYTFEEDKAIYYGPDDPIPIDDTTAYYLGLSTEVSNLNQQIVDLKEEVTELRTKLYSRGVSPTMSALLEEEHKRFIGQLYKEAVSNGVPEGYWFHEWSYSQRGSYFVFRDKRGHTVEVQPWEVDSDKG